MPQIGVFGRRLVAQLNFLAIFDGSESEIQPSVRYFFGGIGGCEY